MVSGKGRHLVSNQPPLRKCPCCGGPVPADLGLRDYETWLTSLPGKVSGSDLDFCLEQSQTGRLLFIEFKEGNKPIGLGQRLLLKGLKSKPGVDIWVAWERKDSLLVGDMDSTGEVRFTQEMTQDGLNKAVAGWWYDGLTP